MTAVNPIARRRLSAQGIDPAQSTTFSPAQLVSSLAAIQGQDYLGAKWSLGLRLAGATNSTIEAAFAERKLLKSWLMRGTLHFVAAADIRWLLALVAGKTIAASARRYRELELDEPTLHRSSDRLAKALSGGNSLTRSQCYRLLEEDGISTLGQRGIFMLQRASLEGLICQGAMHGRDPLFFALSDGFAQSAHFSRDEALAELALRYFNTRGPATLADFTWWSGLAATEARTALDSVCAQLEQIEYNDRTYWQGHPPPESNSPTRIHLLPGFDEYLISYKNRSASLDDPLYQRATPTNRQLPPALVFDGKVIGTWKRQLTQKSVEIAVSLFNPNDPPDPELVQAAADRYGQFHTLPANIHLKETQSK